MYVRVEGIRTDVKSKGASDQDGDLETVIRKAPPKNKSFLCIL